MNYQRIKISTLAAIILACAAVFCACFQQPEHSNQYDPESNRVTPAVVSTFPVDKVINGETDMVISASFNTYLDPLSVTSDSVIVYDRQNNRIMGRVSCDGTSITFRPVIPLFHSHTYSVVLTGVIRGIAGIKMSDPYAWSFTTRVRNIPGMVAMPGGTFDMGAEQGVVEITGIPKELEVTQPDKDNNLYYNTFADASTLHPVTLSPYEIGRYEITFDEYDEFCDSTGRKKPEDFWGRGKMPVINVTWFDAVEYCNWLSGVLGYEPCYEIAGTNVECHWTKNGFRLPTEAEWEYAARSAGETPGYAYSGYAGGAYIDLTLYSWCAVNANSATHEVGKREPNLRFLYDMSGNVAEWCWDWYSTPYSSSAVEDPTGPDEPVPGCGRKVTRGGGYLMDIEFYATAIRGIEADYPNNEAPRGPGSILVSKPGDLGFRICRREPLLAP